MMGSETIFVEKELRAGDFLIFQLESGYALLRLLSVDDSGAGKVWHVAGYADLFPDVRSAESAVKDPLRLATSHSHIALTNRAFESTQVARIGNAPLSEKEVQSLKEWKSSLERPVSDRSVRLMLGLR
jgi:hypothetical protein